MRGDQNMVPGRVIKELTLRAHSARNHAYLLSRRNPIRRAGVRVERKARSIRSLAESELSLARFGDGEFNLILGIEDPKFQKTTPGLAAELKSVLETSDPSLAIAIPRSMLSARGNTRESARFWSNYVRGRGKKVRQLLNPDRPYLDASLTRFYVPTMNQRKAFTYAKQLSSVWARKHVLIVEGSQSRIGVGNNLLGNARSVSRIIAPAIDAYKSISDIEYEVDRCFKGQLVLASLGPAATVLAARLAARGIRCLDVGHFDLEYEWALRGRGRVSVPGRYVNELDESFESDFPDSELGQYRSSIVARLG